MNKKVIWLVVIIVIVIAVILGFSRKSSDKVVTIPIKIGGVLSLTGPAAQDGESIQKGMELAKIDLAKQGVSIELVYQDDKTEPKNTVSAINAIATQEVQAIIGPTWSYLGDAGVPVVDRLKLVAVMPANTSEYVSSQSPYAFFTTNKVERLVPTLSKWLMDNNKKNIALVRNQGAWYDTVSKALEQAAQDAGSKIIFSEAIPFGSEADLLPTIITKLRSVKPDLIFFEMDDDKGIAIMLKKSQELGITQDMISITTSLGRVLGSDAIVTKPKNNVYVISPTQSEAFKVRFNEAYGKNPTAYADRAYDSVMLLVDAIQKKGDSPLNEYLRNVTNYKGYAGTYKFDARGDITEGDWIIEKLK